jgi:molybdate transport system substrate-binding protein
LIRLQVLSAGAAQGVVGALAGRAGYEISGSFGAVGAMREKLLAGEPADLIILTRALIAGLAAAGQVLPDSPADLGTVRTGVAVRSGDPAPDVTTPEALRAALLAADAIYCPDPEKATAGIHFVKVLEGLGVRPQVAGRLRAHPNGATAMRELAGSPDARPIGCTQITEILNTAGVTLVGPLPRQFELATVYSAAVCAGASDPAGARRFIALLAGETTRELRRSAGFEF